MPEKSSPAVPVVLYRPHVHNQAKHLAYLLFIWLTVSIVATTCIFFALGYEVNWKAHSIRQTSIITMGSPESLAGLTVRLNGEQVATAYPIRLTRLFPGNYNLVVSAPGYQDWSRQLELQPNRVASFRSVILLPQDPIKQELAAGSVTFPGIVPDRGIEVRAGNELWVDGGFVTRTSEDILTVQRFPDGQHLAYQQGSTLWFCDLDGFGTQKLLGSVGTLPLHFLFKDGGRTLVYQDTQGRILSLKIY